MLRSRHCDQGNRVARQRLDDALFRFRRHQRHVAIEDGRSYRVFRGGERNLTARNRARSFARLESAEDDLGRAGHRVLFDLLPGNGVGPPGVGSGLLRSKLRQLVRGRNTALVDRAHDRVRTGRLKTHRGRAVAKAELDAPEAGRLCCIVPNESWLRDLGREDRSIQRVVDGDGLGRRFGGKNSRLRTVPEARNHDQDRGSGCNDHDGTDIMFPHA